MADDMASSVMENVTTRVELWDNLFQDLKALRGEVGYRGIDAGES